MRRKIMQNHKISKNKANSRALKAAALILALATLAILAAGCAKPPTEEMEKAASAVTRAENDPDAAAYAASTLNKARTALNQMRTEAESKRYDEAKNYAAEAINAAEKAIADGRAAAARIREEASTLLGQVKTSLEETAKSLKNAREVKNAGLNFNALDQDYDSARRSAAQAELSLAGNDYQDSIEKSRTAKDILSGINTTLSGAVTSVSRKK
jgi:hypothetical protein